jgi:hypothetical protein
MFYLPMLNVKNHEVIYHCIGGVKRMILLPPSGASEHPSGEKRLRSIVAKPLLPGYPGTILPMQVLFYIFIYICTYIHIYSMYNNVTKKALKKYKASTRKKIYVAGTPHNKISRSISRKTKPFRIFTPEYTPSPIKLGHQGSHERYVNINKHDKVICYLNNFLATPDIYDIFKNKSSNSSFEFNTDFLHEVDEVRDEKDRKRGFWYVRAYQKVIKAYLEEDNELCNGILPRYFKQSLQQSPILMVIMRDKKKILGFSTIDIFYDEHDAPMYLKINLLCASTQLKGGGQVLINAIQQLANIFNINKIKLDSIQTVATIKFYLKNGFKILDEQQKQYVTKLKFNEKSKSKNNKKFRTLVNNSQINASTDINMEKILD